MKKTLYIIRHGETDLNKRGVVQGRGMDTDLNNRGREQAEAFYQAYKAVPFDKVYTSTLKRTHQTVKKFIDSNIPWTQYPGLDELGWGIYEGMESTEHIKNEFISILGKWNTGELHHKFEKGESPLEVKERQLIVLEKLIEENDDQNILICMHGRALRLFLCLLTNKSLTEMDSFPHFNTTLYKVEYDGAEFHIADFNNTDHLKLNVVIPTTGRNLAKNLIKISAVSYTNTRPFVYGLMHSGISDQIELSLDIPSECAHKLINNQVDIGLVPVAALLEVPGYKIISNYCIGASGAVDSVFIFSNKPIAEINTLKLDVQSRTSNNLARVLLKNYWQVSPEIVTDEPADAFVQIGDRTFGKKNEYAYRYDLADEWKKFNGLPFVFAVWAANKEIPESFVLDFNDALKYGLDHRDEVIREIPPRNNFDFGDYLINKIDYSLDGKKLEALKTFHQLIRDL